MAPKGKAGPPPEDANDVAAARQPVTHAALTFTRSFRRHTPTGDIYAVELVDGRLNAALLCTRPEELTHGALPVLPLGPDTDPYRAVAANTEPWEPKYDAEAGIKKLAALDEEISTLDSKIENLASRKKKLSQDREQKVAEMRRIIGQLRTGQRDLLDGVPHETVGNGAPAEPVSDADAAVLVDAQPPVPEAVPAALP
jgi:hypothetical protein